MLDRNEKGQFVKGRIETIEEKLKRAKTAQETGKHSDRYIADLVQECPKIYNSGRAIMFTEKGKKAGHIEEWSNFKNFYNDVRPTYEQGKLFRRRDTTKPYGKDNFIGLTQEEINLLPNKNTIFIKYNGESHTINDWAKIIGTTPSAIKNRYYKNNNYTTQEILYGKKKNRNSKIPKDIKSTNTPIRAKASKMISSYKSKDIKNGTTICDIDIDGMIDNILLKPCIYCGDTHRIGCDRIDNTLGHTKNNVVPCCIECNTARNNYFTYDEMRLLGITISKIKAARPKTEESDVNIEFDKTRDVNYRNKCCQRKVYKFNLNGELISEFESVKAAAKDINASAKTISAACNGKQGKRYNGHKCYDFLGYHKNTIDL